MAAHVFAQRLNTTEICAAAAHFLNLCRKCAGVCLNKLVSFYSTEITFYFNSPKHAGVNGEHVLGTNLDGNNPAGTSTMQFNIN